MAKITPPEIDTSEQETSEKGWAAKLNSPKTTIIIFFIVGILIAYTLTDSPKDKKIPVDRSVSKTQIENAEQKTGVQNINTSTAGANELSSESEKRNGEGRAEEEKAIVGVNTGSVIQNTLTGGTTNNPTMMVSGTANPSGGLDSSSTAQGTVRLLEDTPESENISTNALNTASENSNTTTSGSTNGFSNYTGNGTAYYNEGLKYGFIVPKGTYYQGFGAKDGASHSVALTTGTGVTDWDSASVKLWYFKNSIPSELQSVAGRYYENPSTGTIYLRVGSGSVKIEGASSNSIVESIIETIKSE